MVVGLTGQTGAGKSVVSQWFAEHGFVVIDADQVARAVVGQIAAAFGKEILSIDGTLNRAALAKIVFRNAVQLDLLNRITHPYILEQIERTIRACAPKPVVVDAPTLFESGANRFCDQIVCVLADPCVRLQRIVRRDGITFAQAKERIQAQFEDEYYQNRSDYCLRNNGSLEQLKRQTEDVIRSMME